MSNRYTEEESPDEASSPMGELEIKQKISKMRNAIRQFKDDDAGSPDEEEPEEKEWEEYKAPKQQERLPEGTGVRGRQYSTGNSQIEQVKANFIYVIGSKTCC